jgi:hypothetical protein
MADATVPPFLVQAASDLVGSQPLPLHEFCPLQAFSAVLQALWPLHALIPMQWTGFADFAEALVVARPPIAKAIAAAAMVAPETTFVFMLFS